MRKRSYKMKSLLAFIKFLRDNNIMNFNPNNLAHRMKLQKYVFIANFLGLNAPYVYNKYMHGPYSEELAEDYYKLMKMYKDVKEQDLRM